VARITIDMSSVKVWADAILNDGGQTTQKQINLALKNSANLVQRVYMKELPRDTGKAAKTVKQVVTTNSATIGTDPSLKYPLYVYMGTKPHMPPVDAIKDWAESKGINPWALAMSIKKKGTKANKFVDRTFDSTEAAVVEEFITAAQMIADFVASA
jgi:hypothetical protein